MSPVDAPLQTTQLLPAGVTAQLLQVAGPQVGATTPCAREVTVGRASDNTICVDLEGVSRHHMRLRRTDGGLVVEDCGSRNGTFVNGRRIAAPTAVGFGDRIQLGAQLTFLLTVHDPAVDHIAHLRRIETVGRLTAGIVHDFNNLLSVILSSLEHLGDLELERVLPTEDAAEAVEDALAAAREASKLTRRLLALSRPAKDHVTRISVTDVTRAVEPMARRIIGDRVRLRFKVASGLEAVIDEGELHQVLMNLCINARDAMPEGGEIVVEASSQVLARGDLPAELSGPCVVLRVSDSGVGMDAETRQRIFDPFFTTKGSKGTGLGLASVDAIVRGYGGFIDVASEPGRGSTFSLYLPSERQDPTGIVRRTQFEPVDTGRSEAPRVLLLAVDELGRRATVRLLRGAGYEHVTDAPPSSAFELCERAESAPEVVLVDGDLVVEQGGVPFVRGLARLLPIVVLAGYVPKELEQELLAGGVTVVLPKPCGADELDGALRHAAARG